MRFSNFLQLSLPEQILQALINAVCLNSSKMFMIVTLSPCMGSFQRVMKSMSSFNTRTVPVLRHIDKSRLKTWISSNNETILSALYGLYSGFSIFLVISQNYRLMKIRSTNANGEFRVPATIKDGVLCHDS